MYSSDYNAELISLFLSTSLEDSKKDYNKSLNDKQFPHWDAVIITASNELQADGYQKQLEYRKDRLPDNTEYIVVPDEGNKRVGSAGSTLTVIKQLKERFSDLTSKRFLCIHAGGNSSRCPQYSAIGKLFAPIPTLIDDKPATLFDLIMVSMASMPGKMKDGMLLLSGDVILLFNSLMCDFGDSCATAISFKENVETGRNHGVYLPSESGMIQKFLHKLSVPMLTSLGAVDGRGNVCIDTGAIHLSPMILDILYSLIDTDQKYKIMVNEKARLSLYGDIEYCLASDSTLEEYYKEKPEGTYCNELTVARKALWEALSGYNMKLLIVSPAKFIHFGTIPEILDLMNNRVQEYEKIGWNRQISSSIKNCEIAAYNSVMSEGSMIGEHSYLEVSYVHSTSKVGKNCYISFLELENVSIPDGLMIHGLKQLNGNIVCRLIGIKDNPKEGILCGINLEQWLIKHSLDMDVLWDSTDDHSLWNAKLYPECSSANDAVKASLNMYQLLTCENGNMDVWLKSNRKSLCSGFADADPQAIINWADKMEELVRMDQLEKLIYEGKSAAEVLNYLGSDCISDNKLEWLNQKLKNKDSAKLSDFSYLIRLYYYLGIILNDEKYTSLCFETIADTILQSTLGNLKYNDKIHIAKEEVKVNLPLRVNWGGGWSDTAPHCIENGGTVINAAISLNGKLPVEVRFVKIPERKIIFDSRDMDVHGEFVEIEPLQRTGDPYDPFALQKACLLACGVLPKEGGNLTEILDRLGGGFEMHSEVTDVPKGSGLGTSSILSAAAVKALLEFVGIEYTDDVLYATVLAMEQIMSTGGGWQDQVGGVTPGIKFITSDKGINQKINVEKVHISDETKKELDDRFAIIYTGQRRLARNLLRDVVGRYVGNEPDSIFAHREIQKYAVLMKNALEDGNVDEFAKLLDHHWVLSNMIDEGSTNTLIDQIFVAIEDLIDAKMVCGAGGGGFLQVVMKRGVTSVDIHNRLKDVFQDFPVDVWPCELIYD